MLRRLSMAAVSLGSALSAFAGCGESRGELMIVVTTDLSIPSDLDRLNFRVSEGGVPVQEGSVALTAFDDLPATLSIAGTKSQTVRIEIEGSRDRKIRVRGSAELDVPEDGVKELEVPLTFLCSEARGADCERGSTCQAGRCVSERLDSADLLGFTERGKTCFDARICIADRVISSPTPQIDRDSGDCVITGGSLGGDGNVNLAIVVDSAQVGNYGVCGGAGDSCLVPLEHGGPGGWDWKRDDRGRLLSIRVPQVICEELGRSVTRLQTALVAADCPLKERDMPLCAAEESCIHADIGCPEGWESSSCTGQTPPAAPDGEFRICGQIDLDPVTGPVIPGHWCCTSSDSVVGGDDPLLIDDMTGGSQIKLPAERSGVVPGGWYSETDDTDYPISPPPYPALFTYRKLDELEQPEGGPDLEYGACLQSKTGFEGTFALAGFNYLLDTGTFQPAEFDASEYTGVRFWAVGPSLIDGEPQSLRMNFPNSQTYTETNSECVLEAGKQACDHFGADLLLTNRWREYFVRWDELQQTRADFGQVRFDHFSTRLYATDFAIFTMSEGVISQPFDVCVSQLYFTKD